jgi:hypothetical protein
METRTAKERRGTPQQNNPQPKSREAQPPSHFRHELRCAKLAPEQVTLLRKLSQHQSSCGTDAAQRRQVSLQVGGQSVELWSQAPETLSFKWNWRKMQSPSPCWRIGLGLIVKNSLVL